jgi:CBS-domain-containing membrane protein
MDILSKLHELFPNRNKEEAEGFLLWLGQLAVVMHRPRPMHTAGWKAAGEILTVQWDETLANVLRKMSENNISCVPVLDQHRRYVGLLDTMAVLVHALRSFEGRRDKTDERNNHCSAPQRACLCLSLSLSLSLSFSVVSCWS